MTIEDRTLRSLEWERLLAYLAEQAQSPAGQSLALAVKPQQGREIVRLLLEETEEALTLIQSHQTLVFTGLVDIVATLTRLAAGSTLAPGEFNAIREVLKISSRTKGSLGLVESEHFPRLSEFLPRLINLKDIIQQLDDAIEGSAVKDTASPQLASLRRDRARMESSIKEDLGRIIQSHAGGKVLQEPLYTMRNGRYVLPVVASMRYAMDGIVHDASQSGLTIYVEPLSVMELSNKARIKDSEIEREIERILTELSALLKPYSAQIHDAFHALAELDLIFARAALAIKYGGIKPQLSVDHMFDLRSVRHPLLVLQNNRLKPPRPVVANNVKLGGQAYTLVITGPNTGGKTVLLKLIGLISLMVRAGMLVPAAPGSSVPLFDMVCADIGDEQSLEQSLSTFSAHMKNVVEIVDNAGEGKKMLVLLDEVGAGTDPVEGAALARSILEYLKENQAVTIATTHLGELKTIAFVDDGFVNGSFEFDDATLSPTYRLRLGVPGSSKAATIASRLGLKQELVDRARSFVDAGSTELDEIVARLDKRMSDLQEQKDKYESERAQLSDWEQVLREREGELAGEREKIRVEYANEIEGEFRRTQETLREMIASLQRQPQMGKAQKAKDELETIKKDLGWLKGTAKPKTAAEKLPVSYLQIGNSVRVRSLNQIGSVQEVLRSTAGDVTQVVVALGSMKVKVSPAELEAVSGKVRKSMLHEERARRLRGETSYKGRSNRDLKAPQGQGHGQDRVVYVRTQANTLDLRGKRVDEAVPLLEGFVDACALNRVSPFMIIHGHGTGAIKTLVRDFLGSMRYPAEYRPGENYEGGDGVTVVDLTG